MFKIAVLVSGGGTNLQAIIDAIESGILSNVCISVVVSSNPGAYALERAKRHGIRAVSLEKSSFDSIADYERDLYGVIYEAQAELVVLAGFMTILSADFIRLFKNKIINVHPSLIPSFCGEGFYGVKVHQAALERGVKITGATVHFVNEIPDGGPIIIQETVSISEDDTPQTLQKKVMEQVEWKILPQAIFLIANSMLEVIDGIVRRKKP